MQHRVFQALLAEWVEGTDARAKVIELTYIVRTERGRTNASHAIVEAELVRGPNRTW